jgi:imidazolonepropionase
MAAVGCDLLIRNAKALVQVRAATGGFLAGAEMSALPVVPDGFVAIRGERIEAAGPMATCRYTGREEIDASGRFVFPSFVDAHTHLVFAASREDEFEMKIRGATYQEIAAAGGGILNSARKVQQMSEDELFEQSLPRALEIIRTGTGAVEIKSGYGLTTRDELKMLRVAKRIGTETPLTVKTTLLGAHAVPQHKTKQHYIDEILNEMIPAAAEARLADYVDVFCEAGFFSPDETEQIVERGKAHGLLPRIHANQLSRSGGVQVAVKTGAVSADHLEQIGAEEIEAMRGRPIMPTALPGAAFFLGLPFPLAREMLQSGLPLAIASDFNPGSSPTGNMPLMLSLACIKMRLTPEEAINAATINPAWSLGLEATHGSIAPGKMANLFITRPMPSIAFIPYAFGTPCVETVVLKGRRL